MSDVKSDQPPEPGTGAALTSEQSALLGLENALTDFARHFQDSARRWERMVYPAMVIFGILGVSGFWLIYSLTEDMHDMSRSIDPLMADNLSSMSVSVQALSANVGNMDRQIEEMVAKIGNMDGHTGSIAMTMHGMHQTMVEVSEKMNTLQPLLLNIAEMNQSMKAMTMNTGVMTRDVNNMSRPMSMMKGFSPW